MEDVSTYDLSCLSVPYAYPRLNITGLSELCLKSVVDITTFTATGASAHD
jgi:hypothetical protein